MEVQRLTTSGRRPKAAYAAWAAALQHERQIRSTATAEMLQAHQGICDWIDTHYPLSTP